MNAKTISLTNARNDLTELVDEVRAGVRYRITHYRRPRVALVPIEDLERLEALDAAARKRKRAATS